MNYKKTNENSFRFSSLIPLLSGFMLIKQYDCFFYQQKCFLHLRWRRTIEL